MTESRGHESPMDFQWENSSGRVDPKSPFAMATLENTLLQDTPSRKSIIANTTIQDSMQLIPTAPSPNFDNSSLKSTLFPKSITESRFSTPEVNTARTHPQNQSAFTSVRKPFLHDGSHHKSTLSTACDVGTESGVPTTDDHTISIGTTHGPKFSSSTPVKMTGRGQVRRGKHHDGAITKLRRKRSRRVMGHESDDDDVDLLEPYDALTNIHNSEYPHSRKTSLENWVATHRNIPLIISDYLQLFVNGVLLMVCLYMVYGFIVTIRNDVDQKVQEISAEIIQQMASCSKSYIENRCAPDIRVPAMEIQCDAWETCMNRDPEKIGRAKVSAQTFAEIVNSFVNNISYKTMFFTIILVLGSLLASNFAFGYLRERNVPKTHAFVQRITPGKAPWTLGNPSNYQQTFGPRFPRNPARVLNFDDAQERRENSYC